MNTVPPQPKDPATLYGFVTGQPGDVTVNFTANPRPVRVYWRLDDGSELMVEPFGGRASPDNRFDVADLKNTVSFIFLFFHRSWPMIYPEFGDKTGVTSSTATRNIFVFLI